MKTLLIGVGQCGGKLATKITTYTEKHGKKAITGALAINTAQTDLHPLPIDTHLIGEDILKGGGVGGDNERAVEIMNRDADEVMRRITTEITADTEAIIVLAGLGGGTGSGGAPTLVEHLTSTYEIPVYAIGVLPSDDEGALRDRNAGRSLKTLQDQSDATILIDNNIKRKTNQSLSDWYADINTQIATQFSLLFTAGEATEHASESVVDSSEIINTLQPGGAAAIGYGKTPVGENTTQQITNIQTATQKALKNGLSLTGDVRAQTGLLLVAGDPDKLSRKGVEKSRQIVEEEHDSYRVRGGDLPIPGSNTVETVVLLGGLQKSTRVDALIERAKDITESQANNEEETNPAAQFQHDELDDLY